MIEGKVEKLRMRAHTSDCKHVDPDMQLLSLTALWQP